MASSDLAPAPDSDAATSVDTPRDSAEIARHRLVSARRSCGWSQETLALLLRRRGLGTTRKAVVRWERGVVPDAAAQRHLADLFGVTAGARGALAWPDWLPVGDVAGVSETWDHAGTVTALSEVAGCAFVDRRDFLALVGPELLLPVYMWRLNPGPWLTYRAHGQQAALAVEPQVIIYQHRHPLGDRGPGLNIPGFPAHAGKESQFHEGGPYERDTACRKSKTASSQTTSAEKETSHQSKRNRLGRIRQRTSSRRPAVLPSRPARRQRVRRPRPGCQHRRLPRHPGLLGRPVRGLGGVDPATASTRAIAPPGKAVSPSPSSAPDASTRPAPRPARPSTYSLARSNPSAACRSSAPSARSWLSSKAHRPSATSSSTKSWRPLAATVWAEQSPGSGCRQADAAGEGA